LRRVSGAGVARAGSCLSVRWGDDGEGSFPLKGSTSDCAPQWGQRTTDVPTWSGFLDLIVLEHRLHWNRVTYVSRN